MTGDGRDIIIADAVQLYKDEFSISKPVDGKISRLGENNYNITARSQAIDFKSLESVETLKVYSLSTELDQRLCKRIEAVTCISGPHLDTESVSTISNNQRYVARLKFSSSAQEQLLEIWDGSKLLKTIGTAKLDDHGAIISGGQFGSFTWSPFGKQDKLLYVCQPRRQTSPTFFEDLGSPETLSINRGELYIERKDWGDGFAGVEHTMIALLDVERDCHITVIEAKDYSLANPQWLHGGTKIISTAYSELPRRLGLLGANSRPSRVMIHEVKSKALVLELKSESESFHSPHVDNSGEKFLFLANPTFGIHTHTVKLFIYNIKTNIKLQVIDTIANKSEFFVRQIPQNCFSSDNGHILFVTLNVMNHYLCLYSIESAKLYQINFDTKMVSVFDFQHDIILASGSEVNKTPSLLVGALNLAKVDEDITWHKIEDNIHLDDIEYEPLSILTRDDSTLLSALLVKPSLKVLKLVSQQSELPTVVVIHGGPHSAFVNSYMPTFNIYAKLGLNSLLINYRGSIGVSEEDSQTICGRLGDLDLDDCLYVIRELVKKGTLDKNKLIVQGGSHGGFLSCHLSCQDEFKFTSAIIKNPVVDISSAWISDVPDWILAECLGHKHYSNIWIPSSKDLTKMYESSPITKVSRANVPTLMLLGSRDKSVHLAQGQRWVEILRARGIDTLCKVYEDGHGLNKVYVEADHTISAIIWILNHLR